jgi:predicted DNA-binding ribbon-helix-helix protein
MPVRMKRTQVLFPEDQYRRLQKMAQERQCSLGQLVREAVAQAYLRRPRKARQQAARRLVAMHVPVGDWPQLEQEIIQGAEDA